MRQAQRTEPADGEVKGKQKRAAAKQTKAKQRGCAFPSADAKRDMAEADKEAQTV
jgi:hypothetical protein